MRRTFYACESDLFDQAIDFARDLRDETRLTKHKKPRIHPKSRAITTAMIAAADPMILEMLALIVAGYADADDYVTARQGGNGNGTHGKAV